MNKTVRVTQVAIPLQHTTEQVINKAAKMAGVKKDAVIEAQLVRKSVDARKKDDVHYTYTVDLQIPKKTSVHRKNPKVEEVVVPTYAPKATGTTALKHPIAVIGAGPAGLFCAYLLAQKGFAPILLERGECVQKRQQDVERFWETGELLPESNVQFGEGGAGTFSDGKLNTLVKDKTGRNRFVLETLVSHGAGADILYESKPHVGTDVLRQVVENMRNAILSMGGRVRFSSKVTNVMIEQGQLVALEVNGEEILPVSAAVLAIGHSARDTFSMLAHVQVPMQPKPFAVGVRIEHPQQMINESQYGTAANHDLLPVASYKLTYHATNGRSVYSFCMCPGGYVVNASSEEKSLAVNGMSYHDRASQTANSAIVVSVTPEDFSGKDDPLCGMHFQRVLEEKAYCSGRGRIPQQRLGEFLNSVHRQEQAEDFCFTDVISRTKGAVADADLTEIFPPAVLAALAEALPAFGKKIKGFDREDAILSAVESRTSSPVKILRDETLQSSISGLYPCGEGAGYAGGIMSAAMDGLKVAEALMGLYAPQENM